MNADELIEELKSTLEPDDAFGEGVLSQKADYDYDFKVRCNKKVIDDLKEAVSYLKEDERTAASNKKYFVDSN